VSRYSYLRVGDHVYHLRYSHWGVGEVVEEWSSKVPGGFSFVKVSFQDGKVRVFDNDYRSSTCCYYTGVVKIRGD